MLLGFAPSMVIAWAAVAGICAVILGFRASAASLIAPAVINFLIWPLVSPLANALFAGALARWWWFLPALLVAPIGLAILGLRLLVSVLTFFFGARVAGHVGGVFTTRFIDWITGRQRGRPIPQWEHDDDA